MIFKQGWRPIAAMLFSAALGLAALQTSSAGTIDQLLADVHADAGIKPTPTCDDATFLRRLTLDLIGRVPTESELASFRANPDRPAAIDRLLETPEHTEFWSQLWTVMLIGRGRQRDIETEVMRAWIQREFEQQIWNDFAIGNHYPV